MANRDESNGSVTDDAVEAPDDSRVKP